MMLWTEYMMNEIAFLGLLRGKEVGIPAKCLKFNSPSFSVESKNRPAGQASHQAQRLHRIFCFLWVFQSILGTDQGWKGQKFCRRTRRILLHKAGREVMQVFLQQSHHFYFRDGTSQKSMQTWFTHFSWRKIHFMVYFVSEATKTRDATWRQRRLM